MENIKEKRRYDKGQIITKVTALILAIMMVLAGSGTLVFYIVQMITEGK